MNCAVNNKMDKLKEVEAPTCYQLFRTFMKIGTFTIGGGYVMLPLIENEVVTKKHWLKAEDFLDMVVLAQTAPGPIAFNLANLVGRKLKGEKGAFSAATGAIVPPFIIMLFFALFLTQYQDSDFMNRLFKGIRPAVIALILIPIFRLAKSAALTWKTAWIPLIAALLIWQLGVSPIFIILASAIGGILYSIWKIKKHSPSKENTK